MTQLGTQVVKQQKSKSQNAEARKEMQKAKQRV